MTQITDLPCEFVIEEMPQGCVLSQNIYGEQATVVVRSANDAVEIIKSLRKMLASQYPEYNED